MTKPTVYLLCGLTGSGKTTYAKDLEKQGCIRLTLDEEVAALRDKDPSSFPTKFLEYVPQAKHNLEQRLKKNR